MTDQEEAATDAEIGSNGQRKLLILFMLGFFILLLGIVIITVATVLSGGSASFGGLVFIGPIPIVFGAGPGATWMVLFAIILGIISFVLFLVMRRRLMRIPA
jgi:uncharacterized membrane protein